MVIGIKQNLPLLDSSGSELAALGDHDRKGLAAGERDGPKEGRDAEKEKFLAIHGSFLSLSLVMFDRLPSDGWSRSWFAFALPGGRAKSESMGLGHRVVVHEVEGDAIVILGDDFDRPGEVEAVIELGAVRVPVLVVGRAIEAAAVFGIGLLTVGLVGLAIAIRVLLVIFLKAAGLE